MKEGDEIVFKDISNFKAVVSVAENKQYDIKPGYRIYDADGHYVALLNSVRGGVFTIGFDKNGKRLLYERFFDVETELKQAVRLAFLLVQQIN